MEGLGQHLGLVGGLGAGIQRHGGKAGDEHDFQARIDLGGAPRQLDPVHTGHDDVGQQQFISAGRLAQGVQPFLAIRHSVHVMAGAVERLGQKITHGVIVFCEQNAGHRRPLVCFHQRIAYPKLVKVN